MDMENREGKGIWKLVASNSNSNSDCHSHNNNNNKAANIILSS